MQLQRDPSTGALTFHVGQKIISVSGKWKDIGNDGYAATLVVDGQEGAVCMQTVKQETKSEKTFFRAMLNGWKSEPLMSFVDVIKAASVAVPKAA